MTPHRVREKQSVAASDPHVSLFSLAFISGFRFSVGLIFGISEVLSSWRLGSKFKLAVNNVDSALNFVT